MFWESFWFIIQTLIYPLNIFDQSYDPLLFYVIISQFVLTLYCIVANFYITDNRKFTYILESVFSASGIILFPFFIIPFATYLINKKRPYHESHYVQTNKFLVISGIISQILLIGTYGIQLIIYLDNPEAVHLFTSILNYLIFGIGSIILGGIFNRYFINYVRFICAQRSKRLSDELEQGLQELGLILPIPSEHRIHSTKRALGLITPDDHLLETTNKEEDEEMQRETAEAYATTATGTHANFITRIFGLKTTPNEIERLRPFFAMFRTIENTMAQELFKHSASLGFDQNFRADGMNGYLPVYRQFNLKNLPFFLPKMYQLRERFYRAASFGVYFAMRNFCIRKYNLTNIITTLSNLSSSNPTELGIFLKSGDVSKVTYSLIRKSINIDVFGSNQNLSSTYIRNHLSQLRNLMLDATPPDPRVKQSLQNAMNDPKQIRLLVGKVLHGFTQEKHKRTVHISQGLLSDYFQKMYFSTVKRRTSKIYRMNQKRLTPSNTTALDKFVNSFVSVNSKDFLRQRNQSLHNINMSISPYQNLITLTWNIVKKVLDDYSNSKDPLKSLIFPSFARIQINSIDQTGFEEYLLKKIEYKVKELLVESLPSLNSVFQQSIVSKLNFMQTNLISIMKCPEFTRNTIRLPAKDDLWFTNPIYNPHLLTQLQSMQFNFTPEVQAMKSEFNLELPSSNFKRITDLGIVNIETSFSKPPTLRLEGRKLLLHQPFVQNEAGDPTLNSNIVMGIDLGLKDFAVLSIWDSRTGKEIARYILDLKSIFGMKFDDATGKFAPLPPITVKDKKGNMIQKPVDYNIARKLMNIHTEISDTQSELDQCPVKYPNDKKRVYHLEKRLECLWDKQNKLHLEIVHQVSHKILQIAKFNKVSKIKFEDLRWSRHGKKRDVGWWLSSNQRHWLHGKIIDHVTQMAKREGIEVGLVDARWSSQICPIATKTIPAAKNIGRGTQKASIIQYIGNRNGKTFSCDGKCHGGTVHSLDADLSAARNISMRPIIRVL